MSNISSTCASNEAANISSSTNRSNHELVIGLTTPPNSKKRRNLPGNPDPDAEVVALSPTTLMSRNRFICEICNKGFQRDQNLQLHRRGHNLPWKLKQKTNKELLPIKKKVYVCPEATCVHHDPSRALGDLTGIKKHFFRKHGEKKWKCEKCSKRYAVQSDWKAHSKICGTREYRCDCGTLFSRRDSFITHRAFCDALAEESNRVINASSGNSTTALRRRLDVPTAASTQAPFDLQGIRGPGSPPAILDLSASSTQLFPLTRLDHHYYNQNTFLHHPPSPIYELPTDPISPHMSATALLQKAAQMGANHSLPEQSIHMGISTNTWSAGISSTRLQEPLFGDQGLISSNAMLNNTKLDNSFQEPPIGGRGGINGNEELTRDFLGLRSASAVAGSSRGGIERGFTNMIRGMNGVQSSSALYNNNHQTPNWQG